MAVIPNPVRVLIVDNQDVWRAGLRSAFSWRRDIEIVGEAATQVEAIAMCENLRPDVVLMDIGLEPGRPRSPGNNGIEATKAITLVNPEVAILILTVYDDLASLLDALDAGARGFLVKDDGSGEMITAIHKAVIGDDYFSPRMTRHLRALSRGQTGRARSPLTDREREVFILLAAGWTAREIAARLVISDKTVYQHVDNGVDGLKANNRTHAIVKAVFAGFISREELEAAPDPPHPPQ